MDLLLDTQILVWIAGAPHRLSPAAAAAIRERGNVLFVSACIAWEYAELNRRGRFSADLPLAPLLAGIQARILDLPADVWQRAETLPDLHRDPVDRMLVAHALHAGLALVTADATIRRYPLPCLW